MKQDRGSIVVEVLFVVPSMMLVLMVIVGAGQITDTSLRLRTIAAVSARQASQATRQSMLAVARDTARTEVRAKNLACRTILTDISVKTLVSGQVVKVVIRCQPRRNSGSFLQFTQRDIVAMATAPIDRYRRQ